MTLKYIYFLFILFFLDSQSVHSQSNPSKINSADNFFKKKEYSKAKAIYTQLINSKAEISNSAYLKLAYISEQESEFAKTLYYLNLYYEKNPSEALLIKMNALATQHNLAGYEVSDFYLIQYLYKKFSYLLEFAFLALAIYVTIILVVKKHKNQKIEFQQKFVLFLYLLGILFLINLPKTYQQAITNKNNVTLRIDPSNVADVYEILEPGNRLNIIGKEDIWLRVWWANKILYVNEASVWLIN